MADRFVGQGHYPDYLQHKETLLAAEARANALFDKRLSEEEVWIRQGIKARRTRNEGRVGALEQMRREYNERRQRQGTVTITEQTAQKSGKQVFEVIKAGFAYGEKVILKPFSTMCMRGDK